jgi:HipA-like protein
MLKQFKNWLNPDREQERTTPQNAEAYFLLMYNDVSVGILWITDGIWHFKYTDEFRNGNELMPLVDFPNKEKHYQSEELWPFFALRIPSLQQPYVQEIIERENLDEKDYLQMLRQFGERSISNPYVLREESQVHTTSS